MLVDQRDHVLEVEALFLESRRDLVALQNLAVAVDLPDLLLGLGPVPRLHLEVLHHAAAARPDLESVFIHRAGVPCSNPSSSVPLTPIAV